nr:hypothetical protein [Rodentibacter genomosp. 1]
MINVDIVDISLAFSDCRNVKYLCVKDSTKEYRHNIKNYFNKSNKKILSSLVNIESDFSLSFDIMCSITDWIAEQVNENARIVCGTSLNFALKDELKIHIFYAEE